MIPSEDEWSFTEFPPERRAYLENSLSFENVAQNIASEATCAGIEIDPLLTAAPDAPSRTTWRACFKVRTNTQLSDIFYNGRDGLRGRFWQSEAAGEAATKFLLALLKKPLLAYATKHPQTFPDRLEQIPLHAIERSLDGGSAKIWANEKKNQNFNEGAKLLVKRWVISRPGGNWRWAPCDPLVDVKGAFFTLNDREHIAWDKYNRSYDIHQYGFS